MSVHLDAMSEEKRVKQLGGAVEMGKKMGIQNLVIAGDFNVDVVPGTCVAEMVEASFIPYIPTEGQVAEECKASLRLDEGQTPSAEHLKDWEALRMSARNAVSDGYRVTSLGHVTTGPTRAAYDHGMTEG